MAIDPDRADLERFRQGDTGRPVVLLQLLRFAPGGRERYLAYAAAVQPILVRLGGQVLYAGEPGPPVIAGAEGWDGIVITRLPSRAVYLDMLADPQFQALAPQRRASLREMVLMPMDDWPSR